MPLKPWLKRVVSGQDLATADMRSAMDTIMAGQATDAQIGAFLVALRMKGETVDEISGAAAGMRACVARVQHGMTDVLDTCGTGGDGAGTFNISTCVSFVAAGAGAKVAKHGNRAISSRSGSADVLETLGVRLDLPVDRVTAILKEVGFAFLYAPSHHPAMRHVMPARRQLGVRTIMNLLGPITNPAGATHQLVGVYDKARIEAIAEVLGRLGARRAVVVHGEDGLDEVSPCADTHVAIWDGERVRRELVRPEDLGLPRIDPEQIAGGTSAENALILMDVLTGEPGPARDTVLLNAAWALYAGELAESPLAGVEMARESIDSGRAASVLAQLIEATNRPLKPVSDPQGPAIHIGGDLPGKHGQTYLDDIISRKKREIGTAALSMDMAELIRSAKPCTTDVLSRLRVPGGLAIIAEHKRRSPSKGPIRPGSDAAGIAKAYAANGAAAISVLTDSAFDGTGEDLRAARQATDIPLLCKDFILSPAQVIQARAWGADMILLIVAALSPRELKSLHHQATRLGMTPLVEIHDEHELTLAVDAGAKLIGVNNRNLHTFHVDLAVSEALAPKFPANVIKVSESGIRGPQDFARVKAAGFDAVLIGEHFMTAADPGAALKALRESLP